ncbi:MAG TPA: hypothetical protein VJB99_01090 [Patescibacteria group bacterium]|nr:hypothetical protein [Patescibacteria group bacterium]
MAFPSAASYLSRRWRTVVVFSLAGLVLALGLSLIQPLRYSSTIRLLILQDGGGSSDAYTASRSVERLAENLVAILYTTSFYDQVMKAGFDIDQLAFPTLEWKKRRFWEKTVSASVARGAGLLTITAFHKDVSQAEQIANAVAYVLTLQAPSYVSGGNVSVRIVDTPLNSRWPARPNIPANVFSGIVLGGLAGVGYVLLRAEQIRRRHQFVDEET